MTFIQWMNEERVVKNDTVEREKDFRVISDIDIEHTEKKVT